MGNACSICSDKDVVVVSPVVGPQLNENEKKFLDALLVGNIMAAERLLSPEAKPPKVDVKKSFDHGTTKHNTFLTGIASFATESAFSRESAQFILDRGVDKGGKNEDGFMAGTAAVASAFHPNIKNPNEGILAALQLAALLIGSHGSAAAVTYPKKLAGGSPSEARHIAGHTPLSLLLSRLDDLRSFPFNGRALDPDTLAYSWVPNSPEAAEPPPPPKKGKSTKGVAPAPKVTGKDLMEAGVAVISALLKGPDALHNVARTVTCNWGNGVACQLSPVVLATVRYLTRSTGCDTASWVGVFKSVTGGQIERHNILITRGSDNETKNILREEKEKYERHMDEGLSGQDTASLERLVAEGALDFDVKMKTGQCLGIWAVENGKNDLMQALFRQDKAGHFFSHESNFLRKEDRQTILHIAVQKLNDEMVEIILQNAPERFRERRDIERNTAEDLARKMSETSDKAAAILGHFSINAEFFFNTMESGSISFARSYMKAHPEEFMALRRATITFLKAEFLAMYPQFIYNSVAAPVPKGGRHGRPASAGRSRTITPLPHLLQQKPVDPDALGPQTVDLEDTAFGGKPKPSGLPPLPPMRDHAGGPAPVRGSVVDIDIGPADEVLYVSGEETDDAVDPPSMVMGGAEVFALPAPTCDSEAGLDLPPSAPAEEGEEVAPGAGVGLEGLPEGDALVPAAAGKGAEAAPGAGEGLEGPPQESGAPSALEPAVEGDEVEPGEAPRIEGPPEGAPLPDATAEGPVDPPCGGSGEEAPVDPTLAAPSATEGVVGPPAGPDPTPASGAEGPEADAALKDELDIPDDVAEVLAQDLEAEGEGGAVGAPEPPPPSAPPPPSPPREPASPPPPCPPSPQQLDDLPMPHGWPEPTPPPYLGNLPEDTVLPNVRVEHNVLIGAVLSPNPNAGDLMTAILKEDEEMAKRAGLRHKRHNSIIDCPDGFGYTALHHAIVQRDRKKITILLKWGADPAYRGVDIHPETKKAMGEGLLRLSPTQLAEKIHQGFEERPAASEEEEAGAGLIAQLFRDKTTRMEKNLEGTWQIAPTRLPPGCKWHIFLSHAQVSSGDALTIMKLRLRTLCRGIRLWFSEDATARPTVPDMYHGVKESQLFLLFLKAMEQDRPDGDRRDEKGMVRWLDSKGRVGSDHEGHTVLDHDGTLARVWVLFEVFCAMKTRRPQDLIFVFEADTRRGAGDHGSHHISWEPYRRQIEQLKRLMSAGNYRLKGQQEAEEAIKKLDIKIPQDIKDFNPTGNAWILEVYDYLLERSRDHTIMEPIPFYHRESFQEGSIKEIIGRVIAPAKEDVVDEPGDEEILARATVIYVLGPRHVGKSTQCWMAAQDGDYVHLNAKEMCDAERKRRQKELDEKKTHQSPDLARVEEGEAEPAEKVPEERDLVEGTALNLMTWTLRREVLSVMRSERGAKIQGFLVDGCPGDLESKENLDRVGWKLGRVVLLTCKTELVRQRLEDNMERFNPESDTVEKFTDRMEDVILGFHENKKLGPDGRIPVGGLTKEELFVKFKAAIAGN